MTNDVKAGATGPPGSSFAAHSQLQEHMSAAGKFGHIRALDGVRGIAVLTVVLYHGDVLPWGWVGVDLFFVLSGFLITGILLDARNAAGRWRDALIPFYIRRALRILPLAWLVIAIVALVTKEWRGAFWYATFLVNWLPDHQAPRELAHYWSLAVEEQFYFAWPLLVFGLSRVGLSRVCLAIIALATIARAVLLLWRPDFATLHFLGNATILRADPLAAGAILAVLARTQPLATFRRPALQLCVFGMIGATILLSVNTVEGYRAVAYVLQGPAIALAFAPALLLVVVDSPEWLKSRWLVRLGTISYGVYVIHGCIAPLLRAQIDIPIFRAAVLLGVSVVAAEISWRFFESPLLTLKGRWPMPRGQGGPAAVAATGSPACRAPPGPH